MTQQMINAINWLTERYGEFTKEMREDGICHLICKDRNYPIHFWVNASGYIGDANIKNV